MQATGEYLRLLTLEKARRGVARHELVFVGTANVAQYGWCGMRALLKSRAEEPEFFGAYLEDRLRYSLELGRIQKPPKRQAELLRVGDEISPQDIEDLLKSPSRQSRVSAPRFMWTEEDDIPTLIETELLSPKDWDAQHEEKDPLRRGEQLEAAKAERYPTIRWNFSWDKYVIVGAPDGITDSFVYEFKTTRNFGLLRYMKPVAHNQADLYGLFFNRDEKRVQVYVTEKRETCTWQQKVGRNRAKALLEKFRRVDRGELPLAPRQWKCKGCQFRSGCPLVPV